MKLKDLIAFTRDGEWGASSGSGHGVQMLVIRGTDFADLRTGDLSAIPHRFIDRGAAVRKQLQVGDVLIETAGGTKSESTGRTAFIRQRHIDQAGLPVTCASFARFLRFDTERADPEFMYWWLQDLHARGQLESHQVQHTGVARFQFTDFARSIDAPQHPLAEQRAIAHILSTLDDKIELNRRTSETLEAMAQVVFKSWFVNIGSSRIKTAVLIGNGILEIGDGYRAKNSELGDQGLPFIRAGDLNNGFDTAGAAILRDDSVAKAGTKVSRPGDVAFTSKGTIGRFARVTACTRSFVYSPQICFWRSLDKARLHPAILYCWMVGMISIHN